MQFDNSFEVAVPVPEAWKLLTDIPRIAPCMPGAEITEVVGERSYKGRVAVKLGPVALTFTGLARFEEIDEGGRAARVRAQGNDSKGRGGAHADVSFRLVPVSNNGTRVLIHTNLQLSGSVAQYGRGVGMVADLAQHLIGQFADCLQTRILAAPAQISVDGAAATTTPEPAPAPLAPAPVLRIGFALLWRAFARRIGRLFGARP